METYVKNLCDAEENSRKLGVDEMLTEKVVFRSAKSRNFAKQHSMRLAHEELALYFKRF